MQGSGIYQIINMVSGKRYIGSAADLRRRQRQHWACLRRGEHGNSHLQNAWNLYSGKAFAFGVLEYVPDLDRLLEREQYYLDTLQPEYNIAPVAGTSPMSGRNHTEESLRKMSESQKGRVFSADHRRHIGEAGKGRVFSAEHRRRLSEAATGRVFSEETKRKMSEAATGRVESEETRQKKSKVAAACWSDEAYRSKITGRNALRAKLSEQDVREIRALLEESVLLQREIAARYGVRANTISRIRTGHAPAYVRDLDDVGEVEGGSA